MSPRPRTQPGTGSVPPLPDPAAPSFPAALAAWRKGAGINQAQLSEVLGCRQEQLSRWERGIEAPGAGSLLAYLALQECRLDFLIRAQIGALERRMEMAQNLQARIHAGEALKG